MILVMFLGRKENREKRTERREKREDLCTLYVPDIG
jgi:hypothetical protein